MDKRATKLSGVLLAMTIAVSICMAGFLLLGFARPAYADTTVLAFTSDIHNTEDNTAANRLDMWLDKVEAEHGKIDVMSFCGDMGSARAQEEQFWAYTESVMNVVDGEGIPGVYTTGNHEFYNGKYSSTANAVKTKYLVGEEGKAGTNYRIYCMGTDNWDNNKDNYPMDQINELSDYLDTVDAAKPIIVLVHFPLHRCGSRATVNADKVIDVLNEAANDGKKIVLLWGHNHTVRDSNYDQIYAPGDVLAYNSSGGLKEIQFYYGAAGCMSDSEYGSGSAYVKGKGLVMTIDDENRLSFTYYDAAANDVTEGGTFTEKDPVSLDSATVDEAAQLGGGEKLTVEAGDVLRLHYTTEPENATVRSKTWTSSDEAVATVDLTGKMKAVSPGTTTITATLYDGISGSAVTTSVEVEVVGHSGGEKAVDITPESSDYPEKSMRIDVGDRLVINVTNGSARSASDFTASFSEDGIARILGDDTVGVDANATGQLTVKGLSGGTVDIIISNGSSMRERKGIIHLTVVEKSPEPEEDAEPEEEAEADTGAKAASYAPLRLVSKKQTKSSVTVSWHKVRGAAKYVIYGSQCGSKNKMKKLATVASSKASKKFSKVAGKKVKPGKSYRFIVVAKNKKGAVVSSSKTIHVYTKGGKYTNHKSVIVKKGSKSVKSVVVKRGGAVNLDAVGVKAKASLKYKNHTKSSGIRFESTNVKVATVSAKGVVKGKKAGTCYVYAYSQNGVGKKVKVTVK